MKFALHLVPLSMTSSSATGGSAAPLADVPVIEHGAMTNVLPGKVVRGPAWKLQ